MAFYIPIPSHSHAINSHFFPFSVLRLFPFPFPFPCSGLKYYELTTIYVKIPSLLKTAIPELCRAESASVSKKHYRKKGINMCHQCLQFLRIVLYKPSTAIFDNDVPKPLMGINSQGNRDHSHSHPG